MGFRKGIVLGMLAHFKPIGLSAIVLGGVALWVSAQAAPQKVSASVSLESPKATLTAKKGSTFTVKVASNPTTGYMVYYMANGTEPATLISRKYTADRAAEGVAGSGGTETFTFKSSKPGKGQLAFAWLRSFELAESMKEAKPMVVEVTIKP